MNKNSSKKNNKNNNLNINMSLASTTSGFNNLLDVINTPYTINHASTKENLSSRNNTKKLYSVPQKNSPFVNDNMINNYNSTKESVYKLKKYYDMISFLSSEINNNVDKNISLLNDKIMSNYDLLLRKSHLNHLDYKKIFVSVFFLIHIILYYMAHLIKNSQ